MLPAFAQAKPAVNNAAEIEMFSGEAQVLPLEASRIAVGNGAVIAVSTMDNKQILVLANKAGTSTLHLWLKDGTQREMTVYVNEASMKKILDDINKLLVNVDNVTARIAGTKIVLEGDMVSDENQARVQTIAGMYGDTVANFVGKVGLEKMIYLDVKVLELSSKGSKDLGIRWDSQINGPAAGILADPVGNSLYRYIPDPAASGINMGEGFPTKVWPPKGFISLASIITSKINLLVQNGEAAMLAAPNLTTRSGGTAKFVSGGELPLPVRSGFGDVTVQFKEYGIMLTVNPVTDKSGTIYAKVDIEVSSIDPSVAVQGIPGLLKRQTTTEFNSREGETVVLSGLYSYQTTTDAQKVPGAGDVPLLGGLFRNKTTNVDTRDLAIIITPRISHPTSTLDRGPKDVNAEALYQFDKKQRDNAPLPVVPGKLTVTD
ncbi:type II and III secretion system protein family protein [Collimonas humicola]|uniref:type II and III secretion system protein family protein n=1 Tax=Collimonas humicola TaxID=2825886 RepID=UPI001B8B3546|nr:pilus assembly protein N-terminal domain-containing protein [Collimonas humicola]